jgi:hypothetical protein
MGGPLTRFQKALLFYGFLFICGSLYSVAIATAFRLSNVVWIVSMSILAVLLGTIAWQRYKGAQEHGDRNSGNSA